MTTFNYESNIGAVGDGQAHKVHVTINLSDNPRKVTTTESVFDNARDLHKAICVPSDFSNGPQYTRTISAVNSATEIIVDADLPVSMTNEERILCWGTDNAPVMNTWVADNPTGTHEIVLTAGHKYFHSVFNPLFDHALGSALTQVTFTGDPANKPMMILGAGHWGADIQHLHFGGTPQDNSHSARTDSVAIGQNYVDLKDPTRHSQFAVGEPALMTGFCLQLFGYPTNHAFFQFNTVTAIDTVSGRITFEDDFTDVYLDSWPYYGPAEVPGSSIDDGGPATLYAIPKSWLVKIVWNDVDTATDVQHDMSAREVELNNIDILATLNPTVGAPSANNGLYPTFSDSWTVNGGDWPDVTAELDKYATEVTYNGVNVNSLYVQSMSIGRMNFLGGSSALLNGTPRRMYVGEGSDVGQLYCQPASIGFYGYTQLIDVRDSNIDTLTTDGLRWLGGFGGAVGMNHITGASLVDGILRIPKTDGPMGWAVPGSSVFFDDDTNQFALPGFRIVSVTDDGTDTIITIDPPWATYPTYPFGAGDKWGIYRLPCKQFTSRNMTGDKIFEGLNDAPAAIPLGSYHKATYTSGTAHATAQRVPYIVGNITSVTADVTHAYASGSLTMPIAGSITNIESDGTFTAFYHPVIDMTIPGERVITAAGVTGGGGSSDSGLALLDTVQTWAINASAPAFSADVSGTDAAVSITVTIRTDQYVGRNFVCTFT